MHGKEQHHNHYEDYEDKDQKNLEKYIYDIMYILNDLKDNVNNKAEILAINK